MSGGAAGRAAAGRRILAALAVVLLCAAGWSCAGEIEPERVSPEALRGVWAAELLLLGESLPFRVELSPEAPIPGHASGAGTRVEITDLRLRARAWVLVLGDAGTELVGRLSPDGDKLEGFWQPREGRQGSQVPFVAVRDAGGTGSAGRPGPGTARRAWVATVQLAGEPTVGRLRVTLPRTGSGAAAGRLQLPGGTDLPVEGRYDGGDLVLRGFDGRRAVLLRGRGGGGRLAGSVWTGSGVSGTWSAEPATDRPSR